MAWFGRRSLLLVSLAAFLLLVGVAPTARADESEPLPQSIPGSLVPLYDTGQDSFTSVGVAPETAGDQLNAAAPGINFNVIYHGFTPEAQAAFQFAVDVWASKLSSPIGVTIDATWKVLSAGQLGGAGPHSYFKDFLNAPRAGTYYPAALASSLAGVDLNPGNSEIDAEFASTFDWYFGTDGKCPAGKTDFVSVVLHELGHGLGFIASSRFSAGVGSFSTNSSLLPKPFDPFIVNGSGQRVLQTFANSSTALGTQFTGNNLFLDGAKTVAGASGTRAKLYVPNTWEQGSSISHLDEGTYPAGNANSLMTPFLNRAESIHDPGPITMGFFQDMGWALLGALPTTTVSGTVSPKVAGLDVGVSVAGVLCPRSSGGTTSASGTFTVTVTCPGGAATIIANGTATAPTFVLIPGIPQTVDVSIRRAFLPVLAHDP
jgi:hypothetical protein